ncbi:MAG: TerB family tellurite resistance protein, partial [Bdellovibrionales bacterium]|nr:TerB family tellurite resistance protein [Bdellovibrionales bacterium]
MIQRRAVIHRILSGLVQDTTDGAPGWRQALRNRVVSQQAERPLRRWPRCGTRPGYANAQEVREVTQAIVFSLLGALARLEGKPNAAEVETVERIAARTFGLRHDDARAVLNSFRTAHSSNVPISSYVKEFRKLHQTKPALLERLVDLLLFLAYSDGGYTEREEQFILEVTRGLGGDPDDYEALKQQHELTLELRKELLRGEKRKRKQTGTYKRLEETKSPLEKAYELLKLSPTCSDDELRARYKQLTKKKHPDRLRGKNPSPEALEKRR